MESAFGDRPASSMFKFSATMNSDLGSGFFWVKIREAMHVDQCNRRSTPGLIASTVLLPEEMFTYFGNACKWSCLKAVSVPSFVMGGLRGFIQKWLFSQKAFEMLV